MTSTFIEFNSIGTGVRFTYAAAGDSMTVLEGVTLASTDVDAIDDAALSNLSLTVLGTVVSRTELDFATDGMSVHIGATGRLVSYEPQAANSALFFNGTGNRLVNDGEVIAARTIGLLSFGGSELVNNGSINAASGVFLGLVGGTGDRFINSGTVSANDFRSVASTGVRFNNGVFAEGGGALIANLAGGVISASDATGAGVRLIDTAGNGQVQNWGTILSLQDYGVNFAEIFAGQAAARLFNEGTIIGQDGAFIGSANQDLVTNRGTMNGDVDMGAGGDSLDNREGLIDGDVLMGGGEDSYTGTRGGLVLGSVSGGAGNDTLSGGREDDEFFGDADTDTVNGGAGDDTLDGGSESDTLNGGKGEDVLLGGQGIDTLIGGADNDTLSGGTENDILRGGTGADALNGEGGLDTADYSAAIAAVTVVLGGIANTGEAAGDTFASIENLTGSAFNDVLTGNSGVNVLSGGAGNDSLTGGAGGDTLDGGADTDTADYSASTTAVIAALNGGFTNAGDALGDSFVLIENITGSAFNDTLRGTSGVNVITGGAGSDRIEALEGADVLTGGSGNDVFFMNRPTDGADIITDFGATPSTNDDRFEMRGANFGALPLGALVANQFQSSTSNVAGSATVRFFYDTDDAKLYFDQDGSGGAFAAILLANLQPGASVVIGDITII